MLTDNPAVARGWGNSQSLRHKETEPRRIQVGSGTDDTVLGQAGELPGHVGEDIDRVGNDQQNTVWAQFNELGNDALQDVAVALDQVQTAFAFLLANTGSDDDQTGSGRDGEV